MYLHRLDDMSLREISGGAALLVEHGNVNLYYNDRDRAPDLITFDGSTREITPGGHGRSKPER